MATSLIDSMTEDFEPDEFHDSYREALQELVEAKVEGREVTTSPEPAPAEPASLLDALQASLDAADQGAPGPRQAPGTPPGQCLETSANPNFSATKTVPVT